MTAVTQRIPNFLQGISDQPDELKNDGQLRKCQNGYPDIVTGLVKRNGLDHLALLDIEQDGKWFHIQKEDPQLGEELYVVNISNSGQVRVFDANTGIEFEVCYSTSPQFRKKHRTLTNPSSFINEDDLICGDSASYLEYFVHTGQHDLQAVTVNDYTFITNRTVKPEMVRVRNNPEYYEVFIECMSMQFGRQYTFGLFKLDGTEIIAPDFATPTTASGAMSAKKVLEDWAKEIKDAGDQTETSETGEGVYEEDPDYLPPPDEPDQKRWILKPESSSTSTEDGSQTTVVDITYPVDTEEVIYSDNPPGVDPDDPDSTPTTVTWTETTTVYEDTDFITEIVGEGLYIRRATPFVASTTEEDIINALSPTIDGIEKGYGEGKVPNDGEYYSLVDNVSNLPRTAPHGFIVKVVNSAEEEDDYYLEFNSGSSNVGGGSWQEIASPANYNEIDVDTAPHQIIRNRVVNEQGGLIKIRFVVSPIDYEPRRAGDGDTNKVPSWLPETNDSNSDELEGRPVNNILFYRNRLVFLSDENICLSQAGDLFNFFKESMLGLNASDPIDLNCSTNATSVLYSGIVTNSGLVLFSPGSQFLFTTDGDVLSPRTAKSNVLSNYSYNTASAPFKMGANIGFMGTSGMNSVLYQMSETMREGEPSVVEQSEVVSTTLPGGLDMVESATEIGLILMGKKDYDQVWQYKYFFDGQQLIQSAWFNWTLPGTLVYHWKSADDYYLVVRDPDTEQISIMLHTQKRPFSTGGVIDRPYYCYLDNFIKVQPGDMTVEGARNEKTTTFSVPYIVNPNRVSFAYSLGTDQYRGRATPPLSINASEGTVTVEGDWSDSELAFGYGYESIFEFPAPYVKTDAGGKKVSDTNASLTIHRCKFNMGIHSYCEFHLERFGKDSWVIPHEARLMDEYRANRPPIEYLEIITVPVYDRNVNYNLSLKSEHPGPIFLHSSSWEGDFTNRYYRRV